jgi:antitoxin component of MazEF toxin-antitoxin module
MSRRKRIAGEPLTGNRSVMRLGDSLVISLPREFVEAQGIKKGDKLPCVCDHILKVIPMNEIN